MLMSLGQFVFEPATLAFAEIQRKRGWNHSSHDVLQGRQMAPLRRLSGLILHIASKRYRIQ